MKKEKKYIRITIEEIIEKLLKNNNKNIKSILSEKPKNDSYDDYENYKSRNEYENRLMEEYKKLIDDKTEIILYDPLISGIQPTKDDLKELYDELMDKFNCKLNYQKTRDEIQKYANKWCRERRLALRPFRCDKEINTPDVIDNNCVVLDFTQPVAPDSKFYRFVLGNNKEYISKNFIQKDWKIIIVK